MSIPQDTLQAIPALLLSDRITYKGSEVQALMKILSDVNAESNRQQVAARVAPVSKPELKIVEPPGPRAAVAEDFQATG
jgi:hypothetical protein